MIAFAFGFLLFTAAIYAQSWIVEFAIIKRVMNNPADGFMVSIIASGLITIVWSVSIFGLSPGSVLAPVIATAIILALNFPKYRRLKAAEQPQTDIFE